MRKRVGIPGGEIDPRGVAKPNDDDHDDHDDDGQHDDVLTADDDDDEGGKGLHFPLHRHQSADPIFLRTRSVKDSSAPLFAAI